MTGSRVTAADNTPASFVIHVQNAGDPFLLAVAPDMTLRVSGATTVNGELVSSINGQNVSFTPHSESRNIGTLRHGARGTPCACRAVYSESARQAIDLAAAKDSDIRIDWFSSGPARLLLYVLVRACKLGPGRVTGIFGFAPVCARVAVIR